MKYVWIVVLLLLIPTTASAAVIQHIGSTNPADEGWHLTSGVAGAADTVTEPSWRIATAGHGKWEPIELGEENFVGEWTLVVRAKWNEGAMAQQRCTIFDGYRGKSTAFTWDEFGTYYYVGGQGDTLIPNSSPDGNFHTVALVMEEETSDMVFMYDSILVDRLAPAQQNDMTPGRYLLYFGDNNGAPGVSDMQYALVSLSNDVIPEPTTWLLLTIGSLCLAGWWRFRRR